MDCSPPQPSPLKGRTSTYTRKYQPARIQCLVLGTGGTTPRVLGRQLPPPPPPLGAFGQQLVAKGVALRRPWAPKAPDAP